MAAPLHGTSMIVSAHNGLAVCMRQRNLQQTFALLNSSSQAFRLKAFSRFNSMRASNSSANSSVNLATSNLHAHNLQAIHDTHMVNNISSRRGVACTQTNDSLKEVQQRQQAALDFVVPDFISPFPFMMNPGLHYAAGGAYPDAAIPHLEFAIEFLTWLCVLDDESLIQRCSLEELVQMQIDIQVVIMSTFPQDNSLQDNLVKCVNNELGHFEFAKDFVEKVVTQATTKHLLGAEYDEHISPIALAFQDSWIKSISLMPKEWSVRFGKIVQQNAFANFLESQNLHHNICPSVSHYILERRKSGCVLSCLVFQELFQDVFIPDSIYYSPPMQHLLNSTIDAVCWNNDIWSFPKELVAGEMANLVFLISKEEGCSYNKAAEIVTEMMVDKCNKMQLAAIELREYCKIHELSTTHKAAIEQYISCCNHWFSGSHTFHSQSSRFQVVHE
ncbi:unnamed protein product [Sphagnum balticum]